MVNTSLNDTAIESGKMLLHQLDSSGVEVDAALWFYFSELEAWKLLLSLPGLSQQGPKAAYREVQKLFKKLGNDCGISLGDVSIAKPDSPLLRLLRTAVKIRKKACSIRFSNNVINGQLVEDAYIYRLL